MNLKKIIFPTIALLVLFGGCVIWEQCFWKQSKSVIQPAQAQFTRTEPLIIDHTAVQLFDQIPAEYINKAKQDFKIHYAHTSHGKQIMPCGMEEAAKIDSSLYKVSRGEGYLPSVSGALNVYEESEAIETDYWRNRTTISALASNSNLNISLWSWCTQMNYYSQSKINKDNAGSYLDSMSQMESRYPGVTFIYITGNAQSWDGHIEYNGVVRDGGNDDGYNRYLNNQLVRQYAKNNNKVLFDFADIDAWWNGDQDFASYNGNQFPREHDHYNVSNQCGHTIYESCQNKGKAFWVMMAMLAGWNPGGGPEFNANISANPSSGNAPLPVSFTSSVSNGTSPYTYSWNFGDGGSSTQANPSHTYQTAGTFTARLTVTDNQGQQASDSAVITVVDPGTYIYTYLEAEDGTINSPMQIGNDSNASAGRYIYTPAGTGNTTNPTAEAVYQFNLANSGQYYLWASIYAPSTNNDATYIGFDNSFIRSYPQQTGVYEWVKINTEPTLNAGSHQINIGHGEEQARVDRLLATNDSSFTPGNDPVPNITLTKSATPTSASLGDEITYIIYYQNTGQAAADTVVIKDVIPTGTQFVTGSITTSHSSADCSVAGGILSCTYPTIPVGAEGEIEFRVKVE